MRLLYTNENPLIVANVRNIVEAAGIEVVMKNEYALGGVGELSPFEAWPELWVANDRDYECAIRLVDTSLSKRNAVPWRCANCGENNDPSFETCWKCQHDQPGNIA